MDTTVSEAEKQYILSTLPPIKDIESPEIQEKVIKCWVALLHDSKWKRIEDLPIWPNYKVEQYREILKKENLADHSNATAILAIELCKYVKKVFGLDVKTDYAIAGAILHDASRLLEHGDPDANPPSPSEIITLFSHAFIGAHYALNVGLPLEIVHAIRSHTGANTTPPRTLEARIVRMADWGAAEIVLAKYNRATHLATGSEVAYRNSIRSFAEPQPEWWGKL